MSATRDVRAALEEADLRVLLMVLVHLSGDRRWLEPPFQPTRDVRLIADESAGLAPSVRQEILDAACALLDRDDVCTAIDDPGEALMVQMMRVCLGERVPQEYALMMREEMGFASRQIAWTAQPPAFDVLDAEDEPMVLVAGAGASGLALGANLERLRIPYRIIESNDEVGGTWYVNQYPGCGVDTPNHAYSFSFGTRYPWARYFAGRDQLQDYLEKAADEFGVRDKIRFRSTVTAARWDEDALRWRVSIDTPRGEQRCSPRVLVSAVGQLSLPSVPEIEGAQTFGGAIFHSSHWPEDLSLAGKRVAVIGTGASSMQIVPTIAGEVAHLCVFQRSAQWARPIPRYHDPIGEGAQWLLEHVPYYAAWFRFTMLWRYGDGLLRTLHKDPDWPHPERSLNRINDRHRVEMTEHIHAELAERPDLIAACLPEYPPYGKRILLDNGWYRALTRDNVSLVAQSIRRITPDAVITEDGESYPVDVIVLATGFDVGKMAARLNVVGRAGRALDAEWANDDPRAYLGISVPGFPNLFCMQGPNTGLGHGGSAIFQSECQSRYICGCLVQMLERGIAAIDVDEQAHDEYVARVDAEHEKLIWTHPGMSTYYRNAAGRVVSVMPWRLVDYWAMTHDPDLGVYHSLTPAAGGW